MAKKKKPASSAPRTALVVLGMHRSGTSALAGVLARMGADLPQDLMAPTDMNAKGFFESNKITGLNDDLLASAGRRWFSYDPVPPDWFASPKASEFENRAIDAIREEYGQSHLFVLKDPRICRLLSFWQRALEQAGCRTLHVCIHRHPLDVASSLNRWANYEPDYGLLLWLRHVLEAEAASRGHTRVFTSYERLMADSADVITRIGTDLNLKWPRSLQSAFTDMEIFLSTDLQHFRQSSDQGHNRLKLPVWVAEIHDILEAWATSGEREEDYERLDHIRGAVDETGGTFGRAIWLSQEQRLVADRLQRQISELETTARAARAEAASHAANHATEQRVRANAQTQVAELNAALQTARETAETELKTRSAVEEERYLALAKSHDALEAKYATEQRVRANAQTQVAELNAALQTARETAETELKTRSAVEEERYLALAKSHDALEAKYDALDKDLEQAKHDRDQLRSQLEQSRKEAEDFHKQTLSDAQKIVELDSQLKSLETKYAALKGKSEREGRQLTTMKQQLASRFSREIEFRLNGNLAGNHDQERQSILPERSVERDHLERERQAAEARATELDAALRAARTEAEQLQASNDSERQAAEARAAELDAALRAAQAESEQLRASNDSERQARISAETFSQQLLSSKSWRVTAPLRFVVSQLRGK